MVVDRHVASGGDVLGRCADFCVLETEPPMERSWRRELAMKSSSLLLALLSQFFGIMSLANVLSAETADGQSLFLSNGQNNAVYEISASGSVIKTFSSPLISNPEGLAVDQNGILYVAEDGGDSISEIAPSGNVSTFASNLDHPCGLAFDKNGNLFYCDDDAQLIQKISPQGVVSTFASNFYPGYSVSCGLAIDSNGNVYDADNQNGNIYRFTPAGAESTFASGLNSPCGLAFDNSGNLYVASYFGDTVTKITPGGISSIFASGISGGAFGLIFDNQQDLYVADHYGTSSIIKIPPGGSPGAFTSSMGGDANFVTIANVPEPEALAVLAVGLFGLCRRGDRGHPCSVSTHV
jgi:hypothetical protein